MKKENFERAKEIEQQIDSLTGLKVIQHEDMSENFSVHVEVKRFETNSLGKQLCVANYYVGSSNSAIPESITEDFYSNVAYAISRYRDSIKKHIKKLEEEFNNL